MAKKASTSKPAGKKAPAKKAPAKAKAASPAKKAATKQAPAKGKVAARGLRRDYEVYNESTGFVVTSLAACGTVGGGDAAWSKAAKAGAFLPLELVQDDPLLVRVVLGPLRPEEEEAALGRLVHRVRVDDGKLVLASGREALEEGLDGWEEYAQVVDVPPGEYRVTALATAHGLVGDPLLARAKRAKVGAWWRETRGKAALPGWVARACHAHPKLDPGHEDEWADDPEVREEQLLDLVVHLAPLEGAPPAPPKLEGGFVSFGGWTVTPPAKCPAGLAAVKPVKPPAPAAQAAATPAEAPIGVEARLQGAKPSKLQGGPVELPVARLEDLFRLAYLADSDACFELRVEAPAGGKAPKLPAREHMNAEVDGARLRLRQGGEGGRWFALEEVAAAAKALAKAKLADGTTVELLGAPETPGRGQRWRGEVRKGALQLRESAPAIPAARLREALALSALVAAGKPLPASDAEAKVVLKDGDVKLMTPELTHAGGALRLPEPDASLLHFVAAPLFRLRFGDVLPCAPPEEEDPAAAAADAALQEATEELAARVAKTTLSGGIVHHGASGNFHKFDLVAQRPLELEHVQETDRQLARTGYVVVGDLVCSRFPEVVIRGYARADGDGDTWGALLCGLLESKFEFVTEIVTDDGDAWLTTSLERAKDDPTKRLYRTGCPDLNFRKLQPLHDRHRARKQTLGGRPRQAPRDAVALASAIDRSLCRQLGLAPPLDD